MKHLLHRADGVESDLASHFNIIRSGGQPDAAARFLDAYEACTDTLCDWPLSGRAADESDSSRSALRVGKLAAPFQSYSVYYLPEVGIVRVLAVIHGAMGDTQRRQLLSERHL